MSILSNYSCLCLVPHGFLGILRCWVYHILLILVILYFQPCTKLLLCVRWLPSSRSALVFVKMVLFYIFILFWTFSLIFRIVLGVICARYDWLGWNFPFCICFGVIMFFYLLEILKSGNTVITEYLNWTLNPESRITNWSECAWRRQPQYLQQRKPSVQISKINCTLIDFQESKIFLIYLVIYQWTFCIKSRWLF